MSLNYQPGYMMRVLTFVSLSVLVGAPALGTPPDYVTFGRTQQVHYSPNEADLLRIVLVFVEQGDGILIQFPERFAYDPDDGADGWERIEVMIDGGSMPTNHAGLMGCAVDNILGDDRIIEHVVITHHDQDHIAGLTRMMRDGDYTFSHVYHNGLASWRAGKRGFPASGSSEQKAVRKTPRWMAYVNNDGTLTKKHIIDDLDELRTRLADEELHGIYKSLAVQIIGNADIGQLASFDRVFIGSPFVGEVELDEGMDLENLSFEMVWPQDSLRPYGGTSWSETVNGNSVTFMLRYGDFEMLFTGDQNQHSEEALLKHLGEDSGKLRCDVLKVPHHGSGGDHACEEFYEAVAPVVGVCSMGNKGFKADGWQHPNPEVIRWVGGPHRFYSTFIHERRFRYEQITTTAKRNIMIERSHVVIETDGKWFRIIEVPADDGGFGAIPAVQDTRRGDGTRWIKADDS